MIVHNDPPQGLHNALPRYEGWLPKTGMQITVLIRILSLLAAYAQRKLPYSLPGVESNDVLYGGSPDYMAELTERFNAILEDILAKLAAIGPPEGSKARQVSKKYVVCHLKTGGLYWYGFQSLIWDSFACFHGFSSPPSVMAGGAGA